MTLKPGQWVIIPPTLNYWPYPNFGPFKIKHIYDNGANGSLSKWYVLENAPNSVYIKDAIHYKPQVGDKVKILKPMNGYTPNGDLPNTVGTVGTIRFQHTTMAGSKRIRIDEWWYLDEEDVYELVEPKGSINTAAPEPPSTPVVKPTKRVLNGNV